MPNRQKAQEMILQIMRDIEPTGYNVQAWEKVFAKMSDKDFDSYMRGLRDGTKFLVIFKPMYEAKGITVENNIKVGRKYGIEFFERLTFTGNPGVPDHTTPIEFIDRKSVV